jgi:hypothetical protein
MARQPWADIRIRETPNGPELVFDTGTPQGWVIPCTEADMGKLEYLVVHRRQAQATAMLARRASRKENTP